MAVPVVKLKICRGGGQDKTTERRAEQIRLEGITQNDKGPRDRQVKADIRLLLITHLERDSSFKVTTQGVQSESLLLVLDSNRLTIKKVKDNESTSTCPKDTSTQSI